MGDSLYKMSVFAKVVAAGSLSAAARDLGVSTAVVSRRLAALEARLGVRLVNRTTRRLALTDEGASYHEACVRILAEIEDRIDQREILIELRLDRPEQAAKVGQALEVFPEKIVSQ